jgi:hypothetical protein
MFQVIVLEPSRRNSTRQKVIANKKFSSEQAAWNFYEEMEERYGTRYEIEFRALGSYPERQVA